MQLAKQHAGNFKHDGHKVSVSAVEEVDSEIEEEDQDFEDAQQQIQLGESTLAMNRMSLKKHQKRSLPLVSSNNSPDRVGRQTKVTNYGRLSKAPRIFDE